MTLLHIISIWLRPPLALVLILRSEPLTAGFLPFGRDDMVVRRGLSWKIIGGAIGLVLAARLKTDAQWCPACARS